MRSAGSSNPARSGWSSTRPTRSTKRRAPSRTCWNITPAARSPLRGSGATTAWQRGGGPTGYRMTLEDLPPGRAEIDAHRPHAQPLVRGHPLGLLAVGNHRPGPVGEVAQHHPAGLAGVRLDHRAGLAVVAVPVEVMAGQHGAFGQHEKAPPELERDGGRQRSGAVPAALPGLRRIVEQRRTAGRAAAYAVMQA